MDTIFRTSHVVRAARAILAELPVAAGFFITNRCNYRCEFCTYPSYNVDRSRELTPDQIEEMCRRLARVGVVMLSVIGGEPLLRKDAVEALRGATRHVIVQVTTNGTYVTDEVARDLWAAGVYQVNVSVDSADPEVHNRGRRTPKAFDRAVTAIERLVAAPKIASDQRVCIESLLSGRNVDQAEALVELAARLGAHVVFQPYSTGHTGEDADSDLRIAGSDPTRRLHELKARHPHLDNPPAMIDRLTEYFETGVAPDCLVGKSYVHIDAYGRLLRCEESLETYGTVIELSDAELRRAFERIQADTAREGCASCYLRTRGESEPLYAGDIRELVRATRDMFDVDLPAALPLLLSLPGAKRAAGVGLDRALRLAAHPAVDTLTRRAAATLGRLPLYRTNRDA